MPNNREVSAEEKERISPGMPIYAAAGDEVGTVSEYGVQEPHLIMHKGRIFHKDVYIPLRDVQRVEATGVYLSLTREQVHDLDLGGWSTLGDVDLNTGIPADADLGASATFPDDNHIADAASKHPPNG